MTKEWMKEPLMMIEVEKYQQLLDAVTRKDEKTLRDAMLKQRGSKCSN